MSNVNEPQTHDSPQQSLKTGQDLESTDVVEQMNQTEPLKLCDLPNEVLDQIAEYLPMADVKNLRLAGKGREANIIDCGLRAIERRTTTIYIEYTRDSIRRFEAIIAEPARAHRIKELVFVTRLERASRQQILAIAEEEILVYAEGSALSLPNAQAGNSSSNDPDLKALKDQVYDDYSRWYDDVEAVQHVGLLEDILITNIHKLKALNKMRITIAPERLASGTINRSIGREEGPAYNYDPRWVSARAERPAAAAEIKQRAVQHALVFAQYSDYCQPRVSPRRAAFPACAFRVLDHHQQELGMSKIELSFCVVPFRLLDPSFDAWFYTSHVSSQPSARMAMASITRINLTNDATWDRVGCYAEEWVRLLHAAHNLQCLCLVNGDGEGFWDLISNLCAPGQPTWPKLDTLLISTLWTWEPLGSNLAVECNYGTTVGYHDDHLLSFLRQHGGTLETLTLTGCTGFVMAGTRSCNSVNGLDATLHTIKASLLKLRRASVLVASVPFHERPCNQIPCPPNWPTGEYTLVGATELNELAVELGALRRCREVDRRAEATEAGRVPCCNDAYVIFQYDFGPYLDGLVTGRCEDWTLCTAGW